MFFSSKSDMVIEATVFSLLCLFSMCCGQTIDGFNTDVYVKDTFYSPTPILENAHSYSILLEFSNMIVDKTLLIKEVLQCERKVMIITLPRGFGKTVNMEMLKAFLEIEVDELSNEILPKNQTANYRIFTEGVHVSENMAEIHNFRTPLLISKHAELLEKYQGQRPIIYLKFSQAIDISYKEFYLEIRKSIRQAFMDHEYLLNHYKDIYYFKNGTENQITQAKWKMDLFNDRISLGRDETDVFESIYRLSMLLFEHFGRPVVILIDEYDHLLLQVFKWVLDSPEGWSYRDIQTEERVIDFFRKWFWRILDQNEYCERAILNGRTLFCKNEVFSAVRDHIAIDPFTNPFHEYYGFTDREVEKLFEFADIPQGPRQDARVWFYGYNLNLFSNLKVYNSFTIASFLANKRMSNYWENEYALLYGRDIRRLFQFESLRGFYTTLIQKGTYPVSLNELQIYKADRIHLSRLLKSSKYTFGVNDINSMVIIKELSVAGYLTNSGLSENGMVQIRFPNMECASVCARILNVPIGKYSWLNDSTLFRFAPEYYDEMERIKKSIRTRRPNIIFETPSRAPKTTREKYFIITSTAFPMTGKMKMKKIGFNFKKAYEPKDVSTFEVKESEEY
ncbi:uncharacterized protein LOC135842223 [Planococcus citri]|uniref:uncharacterized protein LOC135842223 n=1 Tax=Planococcus citri TaxID=170843 RepID=UPI0031F8DEC0